MYTRRGEQVGVLFILKVDQQSRNQGSYVVMEKFGGSVSSFSVMLELQAVGGFHFQPPNPSQPVGC